MAFFQLPDVPRPGITPHRFQGGGMDGIDFFAGLGGIAPQEVLGQQRDIPGRSRKGGTCR